ncbi:hypothetical protein MMC13_001894 [Lambiella insularis]|nr:hypothetical protein [Lambiella insularis]
MRELRPLRLPQLVEARRKRESASAEADSPDLTTGERNLQQSTSSTSSEPQSPVTPTFSLRGQLRFSSSNSSLASSSPTMQDSFDGFPTSKRPLTEVREEPQEREEDVSMADIREEADYQSKLASYCGQLGYVHRLPATTLLTSSLGMKYEEVLGAGAQHVDESSSPSPIDYDWVDASAFYSDLEYLQCPKRRRANGSVLDSMTSRFGTRFPSLSRKWNSRRDGNSASAIVTGSEPLASRSRANSTRAPSLIVALVDNTERQDIHMLPTPRRSYSRESLMESPIRPIDIQMANAHTDEDGSAAETIATTPLLPPVMVQFPSGISEEPVQSPLQSPKVVETPTAMDFPTVASHVVTGLPSPPLSTKPSVSSFHHRQLIPSSDIPPIHLANPQDEWAYKLGHANFTIRPEPYLPVDFALSTCKQFRSDWDTARHNFMKHLACTSEHYSVNSKIHQLTEEKWAHVDALWKRNNEVVLSHTKDRADDSVLMSKQSSPQQEPVLPTRIPSINGPGSEGKFPKVGDEGIVGPMVQEKPLLQHRSSRKRTFWKFLQGVLPGAVAFGRS